MLDDREYMRAPVSGPSPWQSLTAKLLIFNGVVFLAQMITARSFDWDSYLGLSYAGLRHGYVWQLITFQFLHGSLLHLLLNSVGLFAFGFAVEHYMGKSRFLVLYLTSGVVGGLVQVLGSLAWPSHFGVLRDAFGNSFYVPMVGASAGLFGLIAAFATMFPNRELRVYLFFVLPITVSAKVLLGVSLGISILGVILGKGNVAHAAHAGGMLGGWLMLNYYSRTTRRPAYDTDPIEAEVTPNSSEDREVDVILDKISRHGIQSLNSQERKILETARERMRSS